MSIEYSEIDEIVKNITKRSVHEVVNLKKKQEIILRYFRDGASMRRISRETGISRDTVAKYIAEYSSQKEELLCIPSLSPHE